MHFALIFGLLLNFGCSEDNNGSTTFTEKWHLTRVASVQSTKSVEEVKTAFDELFANQCGVKSSCNSLPGLIKLEVLGKDIATTYVFTEIVRQVAGKNRTSRVITAVTGLDLADGGYQLVLRYATPEELKRFPKIPHVPTFNKLLTTFAAASINGETTINVETNVNVLDKYNNSIGKAVIRRQLDKGITDYLNYIK